MATHKVSNVPWWATANFVIGVFSLMAVLMLFGIMSSDFYKVFQLIFGERVGRSVINEMYRYGFFVAFPVGVLKLVVGIFSRVRANRYDNKKLSTVGTASIVFGALGTLLGGGLFVIALFFLNV